MKSQGKNRYLVIRKNTKHHVSFCKYLLVISCVLLTGNIYAQEYVVKDSLLTTNKTTLFGIGHANMYDTYLSPLEYTGTSLRVINERMRRTTWFDYKFYKQQIIELEVAKGKNPAKNATEYWILGSYNLGGHYRVYKQQHLNVGVGGLWNTSAGFLYNTRNGNNPMSGRIYTNLNLSVIASYKIKNYALRWQLDTPVLGAFLSPGFGQSYYEISIGNTGGIVHAVSLHNQRALRNYMTVDVPMGNRIVRLGYLGTFYQTRINDLFTHHYTHNVVIGFPVEGYKSKRVQSNNISWD